VLRDTWEQQSKISKKISGFAGPWTTFQRRKDGWPKIAIQETELFFLFGFLNHLNAAMIAVYFVFDKLSAVWYLQIL
jgi:hypothetical protein